MTALAGEGVVSQRIIYFSPLLRFLITHQRLFTFESYIHYLARRFATSSRHDAEIPLQKEPWREGGSRCLYLLEPGCSSA